MKEIQSYDSFERALKSSKVPNINSDTIKTGVIQYALSNKSKGMPCKLIPILISVIVLSIGAAAFGSTLNNVLFNKAGEKVYEYGTIDNKVDEKGPASVNEYKKYSTLIDQLKKDAKPGEFSVFISTNAFKQNKSFYEIQPQEPVYNINDIKNSTSTKFKVPVSDDITFDNGTIRLKSISQINGDYFNKLEEKYKEAEDKKLDYIIWTESLGSEARNIELKYILNTYGIDEKTKSFKSPFTLNISREHAVTGDSIYPENASKIKIGDSEGIFIDGDVPEIIYVDNSTEKPLTYHFYFQFAKLKDTFISLIENMQ